MKNLLFSAPCFRNPIQTLQHFGYPACTEFDYSATPKTDDVARVMAGTACRIMRLLEKRGLAEGDDPLLATLMSASIRFRIATGPEAGQPWRRLGDRVELIDEANHGGDHPTSQGAS